MHLKKTILVFFKILLTHEIEMLIWHFLWYGGVLERAQICRNKMSSQTICVSTSEEECEGPRRVAPEMGQN
jgi:hypothetical protein